MRTLNLLMLAFFVLVGCGEDIQTDGLDLPPDNSEDQYTYPGDVFDSGDDPFGDCSYGYADCEGYGSIDCDDDPCVFGTCTEASYEGDFCACPNGYAGVRCEECADGYIETDCDNCEQGYQCSPEGT